MSDFGQLCKDVMTKTNRPDLVDDIQLAVRQATTKYHLSEFWKRDIVEKSMIFDAVSTQFQLGTENLERFRKLAYIIPLDNDGVTPIAGVKITEITPDNIFDQFNAKRVNVFYLAGSNLNIRTKVGYIGFLMGWYQYPLVFPTNYKSWIADIYPPIIVDEATGQTFLSLGQVDEANKYLDPIKGTIWGPRGHFMTLMANEIEGMAR